MSSTDGGAERRGDYRPISQDAVGGGNTYSHGPENAACGGTTHRRDSSTIPTCSQDPGSSTVPNPVRGPSSSAPNVVGGRPADSLVVQVNSLKRHVRNLEAQIQDLHSNNRLLQSLLNNQLSEAPRPEVARWECIKPHMKSISKRLMLGLDPIRCMMFPKIEHIKAAILDAFHVAEDDFPKKNIFERAWTEGLYKKVRTSIINRRGRFSTYTQKELWRLLGVPKPENGTLQEIEAWKTSLQPIYRSNSWRWRGTDPFGADPCHGAIAIVMFGKHYSKTATLKLMPHQLAWFAYVVSLC